MTKKERRTMKKNSNYQFGTTQFVTELAKNHPELKTNILTIKGENKTYYAKITEIEDLAYKAYKESNDMYKACCLGMELVLKDHNDETTKKIMDVYDTYPEEVNVTLSGIYYSHRYIEQLKFHKENLPEIMKRGTEAWNCMATVINRNLNNN